MAGLAQASVTTVNASERGGFYQVKDAWLKRQVRSTQKIRANNFWEPAAKERTTFGLSSYNKCHLSSYRALACSITLHNGAIVFCTVDAITGSV